MDIAITILGLIATVTLVSGVMRRFSVPAPLVLVIVGIIGSYLPFIPEIELTPDLVLLGLLPPLLYAAAIRTSLVDVKNNIRVIGLLAVGLVLFTTFGIALLTWWLLPVGFATAVAFGAVVAPPDAVATTAIARRIGLPRRIVTILEGESLLNDATALVSLRTAILAISGTVSVLSVARDFVLAAGGGAAIGLVVALVIAKIRRRWITDPTIDTAVSFMAPFIAYLPAEEAHASGVIAVVVAGLILGHKAPIIQEASSRLSERINWTTIQFLLENTVFLLIGLQLQYILQDVAASTLSPGRIAVFCAAALVGVIVLRPLWMFPVRYLLIRPVDTDTGAKVPWQATAMISWAGMRGVVTLAAVFVIPAGTPYREVLVLAAFVVTAGTLLVQGLSLPWVARKLRVHGPSRREDVLQEASVLQAAVTAGIAELDRLAGPEPHSDIVNDLRSRGETRTNSVWERLGAVGGQETPSEEYRRLRLAMLQAERAEVLRIRDEGVVDQEVLTDVMDRLDLEEAIIDRAVDRDDEFKDSELVAPASSTGACEHLDDAPLTAVPLTPKGCPDCIREGLDWVHLRLCLACGNVGCCDSSIGRHAEKHFADTHHPVMRSFERGEAWRWCYVDQIIG